MTINIPGRVSTEKIRILGSFCVFLIVFLFVGILLYYKLITFLANYTETQVAYQAQAAAQQASVKFNEQLKELDALALILERQDPESFPEILEGASDRKNGIVTGLLEQGGTTLYGTPLDFSEFESIPAAFRGNDGISYAKSRGLLFTVPVYRGNNIRYVLYRLYGDAVLANNFSVSCYNKKADIVYLDDNNRVVVPHAKWTAQGFSQFISDPVIRNAYLKTFENLNIATSSSIFIRKGGGYKDIFIFTAELPDHPYRLAGIVPAKVASEGVSYIVTLAVWVFGLLLLLFIIGTTFLIVEYEKVQENNTLKKRKELADKANKAKSDFLASMSHEIRTPLNAVLGMNEMILRETEDPAVKEYAKDIQSAGQSLLYIINDILDLSKIESGKMELVPANYHFAELINDVTTMIRIKAVQKKLDFITDVDYDLPDNLIGDEVRLRQILLNLLNNAVKYTHRGCIKLIVRGSLQDDGTIMLDIEVKDTGIGIRKEDLSKLFSSFQRLDVQMNRNIEGTGLGLAITYKLVTLMNGTIEVNSIYGEGSSFIVHLPQQLQDGRLLSMHEYDINSETAQPVYHESFIAPDAKVLVVDDDAMNLLVVNNLLKKTKVQITTASSGQECLVQMCRTRFDVILLDHMMPGMDGIETLKCSRNMMDNKCLDTPVIALTANAIIGMKDTYINAGFTDYLSKPIAGKSLEEMLHKYIRKNLIVTQADDVPFMTVPMETAAFAEPSADDAVIGQHGLPAAADTSAVLNGPVLDAVQAMRLCADNQELYTKALRAFIDSRQILHHNAEDCYAENNWQQYLYVLHTVRLNALHIGAKPLARCCGDLEKLMHVLTASHDEPGPQLADELQKAHEQFITIYTITARSAESAYNAYEKRRNQNAV